MVKEVMLTTIDNPFDPFDQFDEWYVYDESKGYHTCQYLDKIALTSYSFSDEQNDEIINNAIDEIIELNPLKIYKKVYKKS